MKRHRIMPYVQEETSAMRRGELFKPSQARRPMPVAPSKPMPIQPEPLIRALHGDVPGPESAADDGIRPIERERKAHRQSESRDGSPFVGEKAKERVTLGKKAKKQPLDMPERERCSFEPDLLICT